MIDSYEVTWQDMESMLPADYKKISDGGIEIDKNGNAFRWWDVVALNDFPIGPYSISKYATVRLKWKSGNVNKNEMPKTFKDTNRRVQATTGIAQEM